MTFAPAFPRLRAEHSLSLLSLALSALAAPLTPTSMQWTGCSSMIPDAPEGLQCARLQVPVDWAEPQGDKITLGLTRVPASNPEKRLGYLFFNPGGPGGAPSDTLVGHMSEPQFNETLTEVYDLIGMDPRGIGLSARIKCDPDIWNERVTVFPKDEEEFDALIKHNERLWKSCEELTGPLLYHSSTIDLAHDMEALRNALGNEKLNLLGYSYGTLVGTTYASLYPDSYNLMVIDGVLDHSSDEIYNLVTEASTYERVLGRFFEWCGKSDECPLQGQDVKKALVDLIKEADKKPIPAPECEEGGTCYSDVTAEDILFNIQGLLGAKSQWPMLGQAIQLAANGSAAGISDLKKLAKAEDDPVYSTLSISCLDSTYNATTFTKLQSKMEVARFVAPITRGATQTYGIQTRCLGFPGGPTNPEKPTLVNNKDKKPIMVVQSRFDPSTSFVWAESVRSQIQSSVFVLRDGDGHVSYTNKGETQRIIDEFLVKEIVPEEDFTIVKD